jgi:hypothetical protein
LIAYLVALLGTLLLANERARPWAVSLLIAAAVLAVLLWGRQQWIPAFPPEVTSRINNVRRSHFFYLLGLVAALILVLAADLRYTAVPNETFGLAGILWVAGIGLLVSSAFLWSHSAAVASNVSRRSTRWPTWEISLVGGLFVVALLTRVWNLTDFPTTSTRTKS